METTRTIADHNLMYKLANGSGGEMFYPRELDKLGETIKNRDDIRNVIYEQTWFKEAIHLKWLFFVILALLSLEWFVRKHKGLLNRRTQFPHIPDLVFHRNSDGVLTVYETLIFNVIQQVVFRVVFQ